MKKTPITDALDLSKEIVASLSDEQLQEIEGGEFTKSIVSCIGGQNSCSGGSTVEAEAE